MAGRPPSAPPHLPGFEQIKLIGSGGFADVFLYQQQHPDRKVAVKVLLGENVGKATAEAFTKEANMMAKLASHPSIVSIYEAGVAGDGRPYLVMEYLSKPNLHARHRRERFSEADTLRIGIQVAGAVETAHRAGILHRDIKPANILVTDYGRPALTDFGIAAATNDQMAGLSVPWSPPEAFSTPPAQDTRSDIYSLAATLYTLLTDRSPFQVPGASNTEIDVMLRIQQGALPPIGRHDISSGLEAVLARAMARDRNDRPVSALEFARDLQRVQISLGLAPTNPDVIEDEVLDDVAEAGEEATRFRGVTNIDAQAPTESRWGARTPGGAGLPAGDTTTRNSSSVVLGGFADPRGDVLDATRRPFDPASSPHGVPAAPQVSDTLHRAPLVGAEPEQAPERPRRTGRVIAMAVGATVIVAAAVTAVALLSGGGGAAVTPQEKPGSTSAPLDVVDGSDAPAVTDLVGSVDGGSVVFSWKNPEPETGDVYLWRTVVPGTTATFAEVTQATVAVPADATGRTCIEVVLRRANGTSATEGTQGCAP